MSWDIRDNWMTGMDIVRIMEKHDAMIKEDEC